MTIDRINDSHDIISEQIKNIPADFFVQLPSQYQFLNNLHYLKNVKINISNKGIMLFDKNGNDIGQVDFYLTQTVTFKYYEIEEFRINKEYAGKKYGSLLIELLNYFLKNKNAIGVIGNVAVANGGSAYRIEDEQLGNILNDLYKNHGWVEIGNSEWIYNASNQDTNNLIDMYKIYEV